jgi:hypothetical protein
MHALLSVSRRRTAGCGRRRGRGRHRRHVDLCGEAPFIQESILYNPALYLPTVVKAINNDKVEEGEQFALYGVGDNKKIGIKNPNNGVGAKLCDPTPEQQDQLDEIREGIISGEIDTGQAG